MVGSQGIFRKQKPEKRGDYLRVLSREADRLSHLVENVLAFSKIERGSARASVRELAVADLLAPMRERLEARLATAGLTLEMDLETPAAATLVKVDSAAVEHILFNLVDNAFKHGRAPVSVRLGHDGRALVLDVCDLGAGYSATPGDCDDADPAATFAESRWPDADGDGYGDAVASSAPTCPCSSSRSTSRRRSSATACPCC